MATKKPTAKKTAAKVSKPAVKSARKHFSADIVFKEKNPEDHKLTGKFRFFYCFFAATTLLFAVLSVYLFLFATDTMNKYQSIEACVRAHTSCKVTYDGEALDVDGGDE
jgi:cell division protein FtsL